MNAPTRYECEDCEWAGIEDDMDPIKDVQERVLTGELMAAGQCPECGALIGVKDEDVPDHVVKDCVELARKRGFL